MPNLTASLHKLFIMGKNNWILTLICLTFQAFNPILAINETSFSAQLNACGGFCDAPAPDNFQVTSRGPNSITLGWSPLIPDATYTLNIETREDSLSVWTPFNTLSQVHGSSITINDIPFGLECHFQLATNCATGEPSMFYSDLTSKFIIDLETVGRNPINPQSISCTQIENGIYEWVGFKVGRHGGNSLESNFFEITIDESEHSTTFNIKRVSDKTQIYAVSPSYVWPDPTIQVGSPFEIIKFDRSTNLITDIGYIQITTHPPFSYDICPIVNIDYAWDDQYEFTLYTSTEIENQIEGEGIPTPHLHRNDHGYQNEKASIFSDILTAQSPCNENLNLFMNNPYMGEGKIKISLIGLDGKLFVEQLLEVPSDQYSLDVGNVNPGLYLLQIALDDKFQVAKIVKK